MTTLVLELTDEQARQLRQEAACLNMSLEELAIRRLSVSTSYERDNAAALSFEVAMEYVFQKNSELYRRLS